MITADDEKYMRMALREAEAAMQADEVPIGAVIVCRGRVIARGHNLPKPSPMSPPMPKCKPLHRRLRFSEVNTSPTARYM